jgi:hypothetical protein
MERDLNIQKKMLECKIKQLKMDLETENTQPTMWSKSQMCEQNSSLTKVFGNSHVLEMMVFPNINLLKPSGNFTYDQVED